MKNWLKRLIILYLIIVLLKISLAYFVPAPSAFSDDYGFVKTARSMFYHGSFSVHGDIVTRPPLYSLVLSPAYVFNDMEYVYFLMKVINVLISTLIIIPAYLLSKEFLDAKKSILVTILVAVLPSNFDFAFYFMAENLFYPLFLFSVYFVYKSFTEKSYLWDVLAGVVIGLSYMTKVNALALPVAVFMVVAYKVLKQEYTQIIKKVVMSASFIITILPWWVRNYLTLGFNKNVILVGYGNSLTNVATLVTGQSSGEYLLIFFTWFVLYLGYLLISTGFLFSVTFFSTLKKRVDDKIFTLSFLTLTASIALILMAARSFDIGGAGYGTIFPWLVGRIIGRYVDAVLPLVLILGLVGFSFFKKTTRTWIIPVILLILSSQLIFMQLFPLNNMTLSWLGSLKFALDFLIYKQLTFESAFSYGYAVMFSLLLIVMFFLAFYLKEKISTKKLLCLLIISFSLVSLVNFAMIYYNSYTFWYNGEQMQLGLWFNKYDTQVSTVLFDERDGCKIFKTNQTCIYNPFSGGRSATLIGFWMNDEIKVGRVDDLEGIDYVVSRHELDLSLIKETKNGIFLYKVNKGG